MRLPDVLIGDISAVWFSQWLHFPECGSRLNFVEGNKKTGSVTLLKDGASQGLKPEGKQFCLHLSSNVSRHYNDPLYFFGISKWKVYCPTQIPSPWSPNALLDSQALHINFLSDIYAETIEWHFRGVSGGALVLGCVVVVIQCKHEKLLFCQLQIVYTVSILQCLGKGPSWPIHFGIVRISDLSIKYYLNQSMCLLYEMLVLFSETVSSICTILDPLTCKAFLALFFSHSTVFQSL